MVGKNKVLDFIYKNLKNLESDWQSELDKLNIFNDVECLFYIAHKDKTDVSNLESNTMLAFIVLAYSNLSQYLDPHKDRFDNKVKILARLAGPAAMTNDIYADMVYCQQKECNDVIDWYIDYQKDWRWKNIVVSKEIASQNMALAMNGEAEGKDSVTKILKEANDLNIEADKNIDILRTEFLNLDTALQKEDRPAITDIESTNFLSHEGYIHARNRKRERMAAAAK